MKSSTVLSLLNELISLLHSGRMPLSTLDTFLQGFRSTGLQPPCPIPENLGPLPEGFSLHEFLREVEREKILTALTKARGNLTRSAVLLGVKRSWLNRRVEQLELSLSYS